MFILASYCLNGLISTIQIWNNKYIEEEGPGEEQWNLIFLFSDLFCDFATDEYNFDLEFWFIHKILNFSCECTCCWDQQKVHTLG
jgi:hypothetical protein